ncbi:hypothetical protein PV396_23640 [Streptomyces sp. ME02-8801-2C]|uniref:hypothetical protein n=1 Tax=Streptomyces sp. ME02-8801-2C TaxID=3028680 RepID=UPI0029AE3078|nr:hypothetical protein [Streptomyces sp. ME02-8801-2C]MDX3454894.1 hypothetical protein [Streptomyces sp. ME02-8801-2C]
MSDHPADPFTGSGPSGPPEPDFLDRLIARHTAGAVTGAARVRPRLPGPFERVEAVRAPVPDPDGQSPLWPGPASPAAVAAPPDRPRPAVSGARPGPERERTVVRTEQVYAEQPTLPAPPIADPEGPLLRPVTPLLPGPRPAGRPALRTAGGQRPASDSPRTTAAVTSLPGPDTASRAGSAAPRPSAADTAAAREAVRQAAARRPGRAPEQVVEVRIGRLEVTAAAPAGATRRRPASAERPAATVSLADYLARGRE